MDKTRVLIADDSVVIRRLVIDAISEDPDLEVAGIAASGQIALARIPQVNPDVVVLDVEMPDMDGMETLKAIRKSYPTMPVIMFSSHTRRGAVTTLDALSCGATDYVMKPHNTRGMAASVQAIRETLIPKIVAFGRGRGERATVSASARGAFTPRVGGASDAVQLTRVDVVAIGASTGGPNALAALLPTLPCEVPVPIVIVQHMPPLFVERFADRLNRHCALTVREATEGGVLSAGEVVIAPGDRHMTVARNGRAVMTRLNQDPPENSCRPAADVLFRSCAHVYGPGVLAVVLTGMGQDGLRGCGMVRERGGRVVVQDEATSVVWGMPGYVAGAGLAEKILPLDQIAGEIMRRIRMG